MMTQSQASNSNKASERATTAEGQSASTGGEKPAISRAERWLRTRDLAYERAQQRGFVGCNPFADWMEAEKDIDAKYDSEAPGAASLTDPAEVTEKISSVLSVYGLEHLSVDSLLERHREGMERLAAFNRSVIDSTSDLANKQTSLAQEALSEAMKTLQSVAQGKVSTDGITKQAELSMKAIENAWSHVKVLTDAVTGIARGTGKDDSSKS